MTIINLIRNLNVNYHQNLFKNLLNYVQNYNDDDYKKYIQLTKGQYSKKLIYRNELFEVYLITWDKNVISKIHDHSNFGCIMKVLEGTLHEHLYDNNLNYTSENKYITNSTSFISNVIGYHKILNKDNISVSLHIYSPPNYKTNYFTHL